jgi:hypothetical protein
MPISEIFAEASAPSIQACAKDQRRKKRLAPFSVRLTEYLFSLSLNPPSSASVPVEDFEKAISRIERKLGFEGQPRAMLFHEKEGRRHAHVVTTRYRGNVPERDEYE